MSNTPSRFYVVQSPVGRVIGVFTNKLKLYDHLWSNSNYPRSEYTRYESFSQVLKWNGSCLWQTTEGLIRITEVRANEISLHYGMYVD